MDMSYKATYLGHTVENAVQKIIDEFQQSLAYKDGEIRELKAKITLLEKDIESAEEQIAAFENPEPKEIDPR